MNKRRRQRTGWRGWDYVLWIVVGLFLTVLVVLPMTASYLIKYQRYLPFEAVRYLLWTEHLVKFTMIGFVPIWTFFVGSTFGSFLNVVAWRVPQGRSILGFSHCPYCNVKLSFRDNMPVIGWLRNGGRCIHCRLPISPRYLIVEILLGAIFAGATMTLLLSAGRVLPFLGGLHGFAEQGGQLLNANSKLLSVLLLHLIAIMSIYTFALIEIEQQRIPITVFGVGAVFLLLCVAIWPQSIVLPWDFPIRSVVLPVDRWQSLLSLLLGSVAGGISGFLVRWLGRMLGATRLIGPEVYYGFCLVGMIGGWQSVLIVAGLWLIATFCFGGGQILTRGSESNAEDFSVGKFLSSPHLLMLMVLLIHLATWSWLGWVVN